MSPGTKTTLARLAALSDAKVLRGKGLVLIEDGAARWLCSRLDFVDTLEEAEAIEREDTPENRRSAYTDIYNLLIKDAPVIGGHSPGLEGRYSHLYLAHHALWTGFLKLDDALISKYITEKERTEFEELEKIRQSLHSGTVKHRKILRAWRSRNITAVLRAWDERNVPAELEGIALAKSIHITHDYVYGHWRLTFDSGQRIELKAVVGVPEDLVSGRSSGASPTAWFLEDTDWNGTFDTLDEARRWLYELRDRSEDLFEQHKKPLVDDEDE